MASIISASTTSATALNLSGDTTGILQLATGATPTTAVTIDASQNVGIGTASPSSYGKLAIALSATGSATNNVLGIYQSGGVDAAALRIAGYRYTGTAQTAIDFIQNSASNFQSNIAFSTDSGSGIAERMRIDSSGNVLVGKTTSAYSVSGRGVIEIGGSSESLLGFTIGSGLTNSSYLYNNSTNFEFNVTGSRYLFWTINGSERMRIDSSGNLLVACTGLPTGGVGGISLSSPATSNGMLLGTTGTGATNMIRFYNPNGNVGAITTSGSLTTYAVSSDYRLKENLASLENAKEFILSLKPKQGNWKADGSKFVGFVAHEFAQTSPTSVIGEKDAVDEEGKPVYQSMQASSAEVMANLISLVQEQQALIESLTTRLTALESK